MSETIKISDIVWEPEIYPREKWNTNTIEQYADVLVAGDKFPPIVLEEGTNRLLDGYHRWKAHQKLVENPDLFNGDGNSERFSEIEAEYHTIPEGVTPKLYAYSLSSKHGLRPKSAEAERVAQEQYTQMPGTPIKTMAKYLGVSRNKASEFIKPLVAKFEETKNTIITRLHLLGWTQQEISDKLKELFPTADGTSQDTVSNFLREMHPGAFLVKNELDKGHSVETVAKRHDLPELLVWCAALDGLSDKERMDRLKINIQPYDVWHFAKCHDLFGAKHPGRIPGEIIAHVLYFYTKPGAMVIDPMVGSGTTLDVCLAFGRKCYGFDIDDRHGRPDVISHDIIKNGWHERTKKADLIFWDPPYFSKMDSLTIGGEGYIDGSISKLGRDEYLDFFTKRLGEAKRLVKPGTKLAFLMSDWDDNTDQQEGIFIWHYANIIQQAGWRLVRHIQAPLSTQQVHPDIVNKFRDSRRLARLERYLLIAEA